MKNEKVNIFIMAGGIGSRFWPKSRNQFPKQFIDILHMGKSLLQLTAERFAPIADYENIHVITHNDYQAVVEQQLPEIPPENIICEPARNNTAPCIAYAAFKLYKDDPNAMMVIVPSDHLILKEDEYLKRIKEAWRFAEHYDALVTLGIKPSRPDTGYGYINYTKMPINNEHFRVHKVLNFQEKPTLERANEYLRQGSYLWNAGMFIWKASAIIRAFQKYAADIYNLFIQGNEFYNTFFEREFIKTCYAASPNISIDYAVMERATNVYTIPSDIAWSDVGTWNSLHDIHSEKDQNQNVALAKNIHLRDSNDCMISAPDEKLIAIRGLQNFIVVDEDNVLLIYPKSEEQQIKELLVELKQQGLSNYL